MERHPGDSGGESEAESIDSLWALLAEWTPLPHLPSQQEQEVPVRGERGRWGSTLAIERHLTNERPDLMSIERRRARLEAVGVDTIGNMRDDSFDSADTIGNMRDNSPNSADSMPASGSAGGTPATLRDNSSDTADSMPELTWTPRTLSVLPSRAQGPGRENEPTQHPQMTSGHGRGRENVPVQQPQMTGAQGPSWEHAPAQLPQQASVTLAEAHVSGLVHYVCFCETRASSEFVCWIQQALHSMWNCAVPCLNNCCECETKT